MVHRRRDMILSLEKLKEIIEKKENDWIFSYLIAGYPGSFLIPGTC